MLPRKGDASVIRLPATLKRGVFGKVLHNQLIFLVETRLIFHFGTFEVTRFRLIGLDIPSKEKIQLQQGTYKRPFQPTKRNVSLRKD